MALELAFDEALRAFDALSGKGDIEFNPSTTNSDEWSCSQADGLPRNLQAGELAEARASYTPHVPTTPWQEVEPPPSNQQYHQHSCTPHKAINAHPACAKPVLSKSPLPHASSATLAPSKAGSCNKRSMSRTYSEMASSVDFPSEHQESVSSPSIDSTNMPPDTFEGARPRYRYATLIGMAILQSQKRCLTLAQIYKWISDNFAFYSLAKGGWQNSIRHSLTLNKKFIKIERPKDDPGKGSYWGIEQGQEHTFVQDLDNARCSMTNTRTLKYIHTTTHPADCSFKVVTKHATERSTGAPGLCQKTLSEASDSVEQPHEVVRPSGHETAVVDSNHQQHGTDDAHEVVQPSNNKIAVVGSDLQEQGIEPAAILPVLGPSRSSPYEQKRSSRIESPPHTLVHYSYETSVSCWQEDDGSLNNNDFGWPNESLIRYIQPRLLAMKQGADRSRFRPGRAEAEIARIRSSHTTSPKYHTRAQSPRSLSSCRGEHVYASVPVVVFENPDLALPTVSPKTNLRTHRKNTWGLLGSPASPFFSISPSPSPSPSP